METFYVENFGCRANQADGASIERQFRARGLQLADSAESAAVVVLNACTVTAAADRDARSAIRRIRRRNPTCQIVVTGCYAQRAPEEIAALPGVSRVIGNSHKHELAQLTVANPCGGAFVSLSSLTGDDPEPSAESCHPADDDDDDPNAPIFVSDIFAHTELLAAPVFGAAGERTRPALKVQDGCNNRCSFCVIPAVRGRSRSMKLNRVLQEVNTLVEAGYREVVISGINLGRWGRDLAKEEIPDPPSGTNRTGRRFTQLIHAILAETSLQKLRISSVEPMDWTDDLIHLMADSPRIAKHAHVPLQSGSDRVLRRMHRRYRPWHYRERIEMIRAAMPEASIGADVMVGFPGETDADFEATRQLVDDLPLTYLHIFSYSSRPGTPSAVMPDQVPARIARERSRILHELAAEKHLAFVRSFVGKRIEVIALNSTENWQDGGPCGSPSNVEGCASEGAVLGYTDALTDNYLKLRLAGRYQPNQWLLARIDGVREGWLTGVTIQPGSALAALGKRRGLCDLQA